PMMAISTSPPERFDPGFHIVETLPRRVRTKPSRQIVPCRAADEKGPHKAALFPIGWLARLLPGADRTFDQLLLAGAGRCGSGLRLLLLALGQNELVAVGGDVPQPAHRGARAGRDQTADDDVLLEAVEAVDLALHGGFGEHARRLLERSRVGAR